MSQPNHGPIAQALFSELYFQTCPEKAPSSLAEPPELALFWRSDQSLPETLWSYQLISWTILHTQQLVLIILLSHWEMAVKKNTCHFIKQLNEISMPWSYSANLCVLKGWTIRRNLCTFSLQNIQIVCPRQVLNTCQEKSHREADLHFLLVSPTNQNTASLKQLRKVTRTGPINS